MARVTTALCVEVRTGIGKGVTGAAGALIALVYVKAEHLFAAPVSGCRQSADVRVNEHALICLIKPDGAADIRAFAAAADLGGSIGSSLNY